MIDSINQRYFDGQRALLTGVAEGFSLLLDLVEKTVDVYNEALAEEIERRDSLLHENDGQQSSPLTIDQADLAEKIDGRSTGQITYLVDMAKADALELLGETRQAWSLVDRHV